MVTFKGHNQVERRLVTGTYREKTQVQDTCHLGRRNMSGLKRVTSRE